MKKQIVKFLCARGWWRLAYRISPSLAHYFAAVGFAESMQAGMKDDGGYANDND